MNTTEEPAGTDTAGPAVRPAVARGGPVSHALCRVARLHRTAAAALLRDLGLYPGQELVMMHLWESGPVIRQSDLVRMLGLDPSTVTKTLQRMEQAGHVRRLPDPADRRAVLVEPSDSGARMLAEVDRAWSTLEQESLAGLDEAEREQLLTLLGRVEANLSAYNAQGP
ncbi:MULTISPECIES: MarR family winged helix-turn-helix transcriptional regulator [Streptomyces]|uniref:MarR family transcriptional regulator n=1 Tax=Streptomyces tricolor TaxID=68277 RepID=A0ABS9J8N8_9ACTN|nr:MULTISPECIES: MarR family transcriptional regulator [Streptomyces]MCG0061937.1 MarR family transcriptional regulator [Streptomyces tricolor]BCM64904.1 putative MarR-family transcriptional regulator [Streptomyces sp. EAS-AB2608]CUW32816.1 HTH-type transcriptional regulator MgrA [Streptomyces reticuli]